MNRRRFDADDMRSVEELLRAMFGGGFFGGPRFYAESSGGRYCYCGNPDCPNAPPSGRGGGGGSGSTNGWGGNARAPVRAPEQPPDHYGILGVSSSAEAGEIRKAYHSLSLKVK